MAAEAPMTPESQEIARLKYQYWRALNRKYDTQSAEGDTPDQERAKKLNQAKERENKAAITRLKDRLRDKGLSRDEVEQLASGRNVQAQEGFLSKRNTAILVIHGIGEQKPYETLDQFSRNLMRYLAHEGGIDDLQISADRYDHNDSTEARVRLRTESHGPQSAIPEGGRSAVIDIYEYYWAPETEDKISYKDTLSWLIQTTLTPIRLLSENIQLLKEESDEGLTKGAIFRRELLRIIFIYLPLLFVLGALSYLLPKATNLPATLKSMVDSPIKVVMTAFFAASAVIDYVVVRQLWKNLVRRLRQQPAIFKSWWIGWTFLVSLTFMFIGYAVGHFNKSHTVEPQAYFAPLLHWNVLLLVVTAVAAKLVQQFLKNFVGDVAVYTNADAKAKNFAVRKAILTGAVRATTRLLRDSDVLRDNGGNSETYDQIIVAGHSLGSVIAYDTLNQLLNRKESRADQIVQFIPPQTRINQTDLDKISGLITFGSPLDKVHYFFRENVPQQQAVRLQIIQFLQSFKKRASGADYGIYRFVRYVFPGFRNIQWLNAWSKQDPVSGALHFYTGLKRQEFTYAIPIYAHLSYWEDLRFYAFFAEPLLLGNQAAPKQKAMGASV